MFYTQITDFIVEGAFLAKADTSPQNGLNKKTPKTSKDSPDAAKTANVPYYAQCVEQKVEEEVEDDIYDASVMQDMTMEEIQKLAIDHGIEEHEYHEQYINAEEQYTKDNHLILLALNGQSEGSVEDLTSQSGQGTATSGTNDGYEAIQYESTTTGMGYEGTSDTSAEVFNSRLPNTTMTTPSGTRVGLLERALSGRSVASLASNDSQDIGPMWGVTPKHGNDPDNKPPPLELADLLAAKIAEDPGFVVGDGSCANTETLGLGAGQSNTTTLTNGRTNTAVPSPSHKSRQQYKLNYGGMAASSGNSVKFNVLLKQPSMIEEDAEEDTSPPPSTGVLGVLSKGMSFFGSGGDNTSSGNNGNELLAMALESGSQSSSPDQRARKGPGSGSPAASAKTISPTSSVDKAQGKLNASEDCNSNSDPEPLVAKQSLMGALSSKFNLSVSTKAPVETDSNKITISPVSTTKNVSFMSSKEINQGEVNGSLRGSNGGGDYGLGRRTDISPSPIYSALSKSNLRKHEQELKLKTSIDPSLKQVIGVGKTNRIKRALVEEPDDGVDDMRMHVAGAHNATIATNFGGDFYPDYNDVDNYGIVDDTHENYEDVVTEKERMNSKSKEMMLASCPNITKLIHAEKTNPNEKYNLYRHTTMENYKSSGNLKKRNSDNLNPPLSSASTYNFKPSSRLGSAGQMSVADSEYSEEVESFRESMLDMSHMLPGAGSRASSKATTPINGKHYPKYNSRSNKHLPDIRSKISKADVMESLFEDISPISKQHEHGGSMNRDRSNASGLNMTAPDSDVSYEYDPYGSSSNTGESAGASAGYKLHDDWGNVHDDLTRNGTRHTLEIEEGDGLVDRHALINQPGYGSQHSLVNAKKSFLNSSGGGGYGVADDMSVLTGNDSPPQPHGTNTRSNGGGNGGGGGGLKKTLSRSETAKQMLQKRLLSRYEGATEKEKLYNEHYQAEMNNTQNEYVDEIDDWRENNSEVFRDHNIQNKASDNALSEVTSSMLSLPKLANPFKFKL